MDITVRLYKLHDFDLIYLYKNLRFPIRDAMKKALISYVRNEPVFFDFPIEIPESDKLIDIKSSQFHIKLDENTDKDIILYLSGLKRFYRNSFLKNLLRGYLTGPAAFVYESEINLNKSIILLFKKIFIDKIIANRQGNNLNTKSKLSLAPSTKVS